MAQDPKTIVRFSSRLWSEEVAEARAQQEMDALGPGNQAIAALYESRDIQYEFVNGRRMLAPTNPYA